MKEWVWERERERKRKPRQVSKWNIIHTHIWLGINWALMNGICVLAAYTMYRALLLSIRFSLSFPLVLSALSLSVTLFFWSLPALYSPAFCSRSISSSLLFFVLSPIFLQLSRYHQSAKWKRQFISIVDFSFVRRMVVFSPIVVVVIIHLAFPSITLLCGDSKRWCFFRLVGCAGLLPDSPVTLFTFIQFKVSPRTHKKRRRTSSNIHNRGKRLLWHPKIKTNKQAKKNPHQMQNKTKTGCSWFRCCCYAISMISLALFLFILAHGLPRNCYV